LKDEQEELHVARKNFLAFRYENLVLPQIRVMALEKELGKIGLEMKLHLSKLGKEANLEEMYKEFIPPKERQELQNLEAKISAKREKFAKEALASIEGSSNPKFSDKERAMLQDVEYAVRWAISKDKYDEVLTTIPEMDVYGEKKKEWEKFVRDKEKIEDKDVRKTEIDAELKARKEKHKDQFIKETPVHSMNEYIRVKIEPSTIPREFFFHIEFCRQLQTSRGL